MVYLLEIFDQKAWTPHTLILAKIWLTPPSGFSTSCIYGHYTQLKLLFKYNYILNIIRNP